MHQENKPVYYCCLHVKKTRRIKMLVSTLFSLSSWVFRLSGPFAVWLMSWPVLLWALFRAVEDLLTSAAPVGSWVVTRGQEACVGGCPLLLHTLRLEVKLHGFCTFSLHECTKLLLRRVRRALKCWAPHGLIVNPGPFPFLGGSFLTAWARHSPGRLKNIWK